MEDSSRRFCNFKTTASKRHKATVSDQVHSAPAPIPSVALSSNPEAPPPGSVVKKSNIKCYNCSREGHYQSGCQFLAHCSRCAEDGHTTGMCPLPVKPAELQWYGYAVDGAGFHCLEMGDVLLAASVAEQENATIVIINDIDPRSKLSEQLLSDDLKKLVDANWDWQVRRDSDSDFSVVFPKSASLNLCKNSGGLMLPISKVSVLFVEPRLDPAASVVQGVGYVV
jgi:hypothetical protein